MRSGMDSRNVLNQIKSNTLSSHFPISSESLTPTQADAIDDFAICHPSEPLRQSPRSRSLPIDAAIWVTPDWHSFSSALQLTSATRVDAVTRIFGEFWARVDDWLLLLFGSKGQFWLLNCMSLWLSRVVIEETERVFEEYMGDVYRGLGSQCWWGMKNVKFGCVVEG